MKKQVILAAVIVATVVLAMVGAASAATTAFTSAGVTINAHVTGVCKEDTALSFGANITVDATGGNQTFTPTTDEAVHCAAGRSYNVLVKGTNSNTSYVACPNATATSGVPMTFHSPTAGSTDFTYYVSCQGVAVNAGGTFAGAGNTSIPLGVQLYVASADAATADALTDYSDTITLTIEY